jgi:class 3 adenylate cyclase/tetratricopeptide (TPR) repeat protein
MKCPICQFENPEGAKYCNECSFRLANHSESLSQELSSKDLSSDEILDKIQRYLPKGLTEKILAQRDKIEGERKQVTVMFCDMVGFTAFVDEMGPEAGYAVMDQVYEILIHKVREYEGTINEMTGDGIMALFGAPIALEDAPQRALRSALSIHREIAKFNARNMGQSRLPLIKMRAGIHTGPVVVGTLGNDLRVEFKAVGDTVNLASRMEGLAEPGTTYVTDEICKLTKGLFQFKPLGAKAVKGKKGSVSVYKLLSAKEDVYRPRLGSERMIYSEMVGRDKELNRLALQIRKAVTGAGSVVNIIGEAGIGKSRLVAELKNRDVIKRVTLFEGRAISIGRNLSFHPVIDILKQWARIREDDGEAASLGKLETAVMQVYPDEVGEVLPFVATLMGLKPFGRYAERLKGIEGEALEKLIVKTMRDLLMKVTELAPLVIVAEDLHWADASSIELLESLFRLVATRRIVFINVFRPGYSETSDRIVETVKEKLKVYHVEIVLQPLDEHMSETLINNMLSIRGLPHGVSDQIIKRAGGNPFFIEEVVRSFIDEGVVVSKNGKFEVTDKIDTVIIPRTINDVLMARIDLLEEKTRGLVKVASVIGRNFFYRILTDVAQTIEDIDRRLAHLKEVQLIRERRRMQELEYLFKHAIAQEAAYESILQQKRKKLHLKVAESIERVFREKLPEFYGMLAYHYSEGENLVKAEEYLIKAGEEALRSSASREALNFYQQGLKLYQKKYGEAADPEKVALFEKNIALAFFNKGQYENALRHFNSVLERWGEGIPKNRIIMASKLIYNLLNVIANLYLPLRKTGKLPTRRDNEIFDLCYKRSIALVDMDPKRCFIEFLSTLKRLNKFDIAKVENGVGMWMSGSGLFSWTGISFKLSKKIIEYAKDAIDKNDNKQIFYYELFELLYKSSIGNWFNVKEYDENLVDFNLRIGESWHVSTYLVFHGLIKIYQGAFREAEAIIRKLSEIWESYGNENAKKYQYPLKLLCLMVFQKFDDAQNEAERGISFQIQTGREEGNLFNLGYKAINQIYQKDISGAKESLLQAKAFVSKQAFVPPIYISSYLLGQFFLDLYLLEQAIGSNGKFGEIKYRQNAAKSGKRALKNSKKYAFDRANIFRLMGIYYWLIGRQKKAVRFWNKSINQAKSLGARVDLAKTHLEIGKRLLENTSRFCRMNDITAEEHLEKARSLFEEFGLQEELGELDKIIV